MGKTAYNLVTFLVIYTFTYYKCDNIKYDEKRYVCRTYYKETRVTQRVFEGKHERNKLLGRTRSRWQVILECFQVFMDVVNPLNVELNPICHWLSLLGAHPIFHVSKKRVNQLVFFWIYALCGMHVVQRSSQTLENTSTTRRIKAKCDNPY